MIPQEFDYLAPKTLNEALALLAEREDAKLLAGGHSLLPMMKLRLATPAALIDLGKVSGLAGISEEGERIVIGAMTTHAAIEKSELLARRAPLQRETAAEIGDVQVRNCGTIGGSLAHADPSGDWPAAMLALEAEMTLVSRQGTRTVAATDFFVDILTSALEPGEILTEIHFTADRGRTGSAYRKLHQPASGYALVGVAARVELDEGKRCRQARVGITGVGSKAYRATLVEQALENQSVSAKLIAQAAGKAAAGVEARSDLHGSAEYRAAMAEVFTRRALTAACERARHGGQARRSK